MVIFIPLVMGTQPKVLIMGAGLIGLSTAYALQKQGAEVTITDARSSAMRGTSHANSGMIHPSQSRPWIGSGDLSYDSIAAKVVLELAEDSRKSVMKNVQALNLTEISERPSGCYQIYPNMTEVRVAQQIYNALGIESVTVMDVVKTAGHIALYFPNDHSGNAYDYGVALQKYLKSEGAVFIYEADDLILRRGQKGITAQLKGHVFQCDHVVVCAGPQSPDILKTLGLKLFLENSRGFAVDFARPDIELPDCPLMEVEARSTLTVLGETLRLSGTMNEASARPLLQRWFSLAPDIMKRLSPARKIWSGLRPVSVTGRPIISPTSIKGLWVNTGHGHMGWTLSAGSGDLMADMILHGRVDNRFQL